MIIWRGFGILVVLITALALVLMQWFGNTLPGGYSAYRQWLFPIGLLLAAAITWPLGRYLNGQPGRVLVDPQTGQQVTLRREHSLFFIRMEYWAAVLAAGALVLFFLAALG
jgi:hypothetical protein